MRASLSARLCGLLNGALVAYMKLPPFIVTLGTWNIVMATNFIYSANETIRDADIDAQAPLLHLFGASFKVGSAVLTLASSPWWCWCWCSGTCSTTRPGAGMSMRWATIRRRRSYRASRRKKHADGGLLAGRPDRALRRLGAHRPQRFDFALLGVTDYNLQAITATVIGGISLFGGRGSILGTLFGAHDRRRRLHGPATCSAPTRNGRCF